MGWNNGWNNNTDTFPGPRWGEQAAIFAGIPQPGMGNANFNPFQPMMPNWGPGGDWDRFNDFGRQRILLNQQQAPERAKIQLLQSLLGPNGALGKLLGGLGGLGLGGGVMTGFQSTNSPQSAGLLSGLGK